MKIAILSDIHSNLEALQAVLADVAAQSVDKIYCLGDVIGYGPNPRECLDLARAWDLVLLGNHDHAVLFEPRDFNPIAEEATFWTRRQLDVPVPDQETSDRRWEFLAELPLGHSENGVILVHGSVRQPLNEYVFPADIHNKGKMDRLFAQVEQFCFQGHTHVPGIFTERREFFAPMDIDYSYTRRQGKIICNVGSVGQPRDGDWRSCYVLFDGEIITFRRVEYNVEATVKKIHATAELDRFLGDRLLLGR